MFPGARVARTRCDGGAPRAGAGSVARMMVGTAETRLVVLRGNSASGKSTVAAEIRNRFGRGLALVGQDNLRRTVLRERDVAGGANTGLIDTGLDRLPAVDA